MTFPPELILEILQYLTKAQLKSVRLVSKLWSGCATEYLFAKLYISSHELDLQIFKAVTQDPVLSRCVKEVEYDAVHFSRHITISEYVQLLWVQTREIATAEFKNPDPQICQYVAIRRESMNWYRLWGDMKDRVVAQYHDFAFIREGYEKWKEEATLEMRFSEEPTFLSSLILGLKQLSRLKTVKMRDTWSYNGKLSGEGSPLARSWNPFHAHPDMICDGHEGLKQSRASEDFWLLTSALHKAGRTEIRKLLFETELHPSPFEVGSDEKQDRVNLGVAAYCTLEDLKFSFARWPIDPRGLSYNLPVLKPMLESMTSLKRLELDFYDVHLIDEYISLFPYAMVFPKKGHWPQVTTFTLIGLEIGTKDLITLLTTKMPSLRHLTFGSISLLDGRWEGVFEYLRVSDRLSSFHIIFESLLRQNGNREFFPYYEAPRSSGMIHGFISSIEEYVVNWRHNPTLRHPNLRPDQPAQSSLDYLHDVYRLCGMDAIGDTLDGIAKHMIAEVARFTSSESTERE